ncbi:RecQ Helicase, SPEC and KAR9 domain-containing protein [Histoplasma capsulatum]|uniref:RecQ Helicase, SPEC and KAR9 domain-containing protein n=1 Tax=Ajellomyces capsulatus TaxID=5037 RepID=A0A8A1M4D0_AJECA|nr:RecQ Helicase, SPEC and KAR9 domain-containing protein [Histoplasma capsulatum]
MPSIFSPASESASALTSTASPAATTPTANTSNTSPISVPSTRRSTSQVAQSLASWPDTTSTSISPTSPTPLPTHTPSSADSNNKNNKNNAPSRRNESLSPSPAAQKPRSSFLRRLSPGLAARVKLLDDSSKSTPTALTRSRSTIGRIPEGHLKELDSAHKDLSIKVLRRGRAWSGGRGVLLTPEPASSPSELESGRLKEDCTTTIDTTTPEADSRVSDPSGPLLTAQVGEKLTEMSAVQEVQTTVLDTEASHGSGSPTDLEKYLRSSVQPAEGAPPPPPPKDSPPLPANGSSTNVESYFNPLGLSRTESIYSFSRATFSNQLSQLTSISLPQPASLEASIKAISTAPAAVRALSGAASQIQQWIDKASDVLSGLDAEDDVEWAAAGGREGLEDVDKAVSKFESLVNVYVKAIEEVQLRNDIADVGSDQLRAIVVQVESTLENWKGVKSQLRGVKEQVELAMEWEELWTNVLGDVGMEMDNLSRLIFEMEEKRHKTMITESETEPNNSLDINELETIVEESPAHGSTSSSSQYKHGHVFGAAPPQLEAPTVQNAEDDSSLLALFARMQPLRASLAFLPMRLSMFQSRAEKIFPSACDELEARRKRLEKGYKKLEADAEALRRELGEDRWNLVFRNAGRQAHKMFKSVERTINKLQEAIDSGFHNANSAALAKKIESFENKKVHYGEAIDRVLAIIQKGINDRLTVNGEIIRLLADLKARSEAMKDRICVMDSLLEDLNATKSQQLRDSISSIVTLDSPATRSAIDTPDSSPASSVVMSSTNGVNSGVASSINGSSRRGSSTGNPITKATATKLKRYSGLPQAPPAPRRSSIPRTTSTSSHLTSPSPRLSTLSPTPSTPRPGSRNSYGQQNPTSNKPRWNGSANTNDLIVGHNFKPLSLTTPSPHRKLNFPTNSRSCLPLPSPLSRESSASPAPSSRRPSSRLTGSRIASPAPDRGGVASPTPTRSRLIGPPPYSKFCKNSSSTLTGPSPALSKTPRSRQSYAGQPSARAVSTNTLNTIGGSGENGAKKAATRPGTALGHSSRRTSMLPQPRGSKSGRDSMGLSSKGLEERPPWR